MGEIAEEGGVGVVEGVIGGLVRIKGVDEAVAGLVKGGEVVGPGFGCRGLAIPWLTISFPTDGFFDSPSFSGISLPVADSVSSLFSTLTEPDFGGGTESSSDWLSDREGTVVVAVLFFVSFNFLTVT